MCHVLGAGTQMEHGKNLRAGIDGQPEPEHLCGAAQPGSQFVQLEVRELEMAEGALVQGLCVLASTGQPGGDGGLSKAEDTLCRGRIQPFGQRREHHGDLVGRGFQTIEGSVTPRSERGVASLTTKGLDVLGMAMLAIPDQGVDVSIGDPGVWALRLGQAKPSVFTRLGAPRRLLTSRQGRTGSRRWPSTRRGSGGETTGGAIVWASGA